MLIGNIFLKAKAYLKKFSETLRIEVKIQNNFQ